MMNLIFRFRQFKELLCRDKKILVLSMLFLPLITFLLLAFGYRKAKSLLLVFFPTKRALHPPQGDELQAAHDLARIIRIAARHNIYQANCLKQALLLWFLLGRRSIASEIKIGAQKDANSQFHAHAWVECNGVPLIDDMDTIANFSVFQEYAK